jgi:hypothetical protein
VSDSTSAHIYLEAVDSTDIPRFIDAVFDRLALAGHGKIKISSSPSFLRRGLIDQAVKTPERLVYESAPILQEGLTQDRPESILFPGGKLNTHLTQSLNKTETAQLIGVWDGLKEERAGDLEIAVEKKVSTLIRERGISDVAAREIVKSHQNNMLEEGLTLYTRDHGIMTVSELVTEGEKHDGAAMADPIDPDYDGGSTSKAKFFWNNGNWKIFSQAHGGITYKAATLDGDGNLIGDRSGDNDKDELEKGIDRYNKKFAAVMLTGKFAVLCEEASLAFDGTETSFWQKGAFLDYYANDRVAVENAKGDVKMVSIAAAWLTHQDRRSYKGIVFDPSMRKYPRCRYNMFRGFNLKPQPGKCDAILSVMLNDICCGDHQLFDYLCAWFAQILREPWKKTGTCLVFSSGQGCGKGLMMRFFREILTGYYIQILNSNLLVGRFNDLLQGKLLVFADEAVFAGDKEAASRLKGLITEDKMLIEPKNIGAYEIDSYVNLVVASNGDHVATIETDDRRTVVFSFSEEHKNDWNYFDPAWEELRNGGPAALMHTLLAQDYSHIKLNEIPDTQARVDQQEKSLDSVQSFWLEVLDRGYILTPDPKGDDTAISICVNEDNRGEIVGDVVDYSWPTGAAIRMSFIYDEYLAFCRKKGGRYPFSNRSFWSATKQRNNRTSIFRGKMVVVVRHEAKMLRVDPLDFMRDIFCRNVFHYDFQEISTSQIAPCETSLPADLPPF